MGETRLSQQEELERRLERRKQLKEERLAAGLAVDDEALDAEMERIDEEEKKRRRVSDNRKAGIEILKLGIDNGINLL